MADTDTLSSEDIQALVHTQQQLYSAKDPRAEKLYNFIVKAGYATKDAQGGLIPSGSKPNSASGGWTLPGAGQAIVAGLKNLNDKQNQMVSEVASGTSPFHQAFDAASQTQPVDTSSVGGFAKSVANDLGAGATRLFTPIVHPIDTAKGLVKMGQVAFDPLGHQDTIQQAVAPFVKNPTGEAVAAIPQAALMLAGAGAKGTPEESTQIPRGGGPPQPGTVSGGASAENPTGAMGVEGQNGFPANVYSKAQSAGAKLFPSFVDGPPENLLTRAIKPGKNNIQWDQSIQQAVPLMKSAESAIGHPIANFEDAVQAAKLAKQDIWNQYQQRLGPAAAQGLTIDGNQIARAMLNSLDERTALQNPALVDKVRAIADTYRGNMPLEKAEDFLQSTNRDLITYYAKNKVSQSVAEADPQMAATVAEGNALRDALYSKLDSATGPGSAQLKKAYGALSNVQKELTGRAIVWARQNPVSLAEQVSTAQGIGSIAKGVVTLPFRPFAAAGDIAGGVRSIASQKLMSALNDSDNMIARAFSKASKATPFPKPSFSGPTFRQRQLPAQSGGAYVTPYDPGMTPGERSAALMQYLRQRQQLSLPANVQPTQLPPSF